MRKNKDSGVKRTIATYPDHIRTEILSLRQLIFEAAIETEGVGALQETLKWGQPSYIAKGGSTVRIGWSASKPNEFAIFFHCATKLVDTFKELYPEQFNYQGNRAIVFEKESTIAVEELKHCISLALTYHKVRHLPLLGA